MTRDMTKGSCAKLILGFAVPLFFGFLFQQFYNLVDTVIVGRFLGVDELASVGATGSVNFLIIGFCMGVCMGNPAAWILADAFLIPAYFIVCKTLRKRFNTQSSASS